MDSIQTLLQSRQRNEPPEIAAIKAYVQANFNQPVNVAIKSNAITITAKSAALASTLRMHTTQLSKAAQTKKKLFFRIG